MESIRIGIVGSGFMGRTYAECLTKYNQGASLVAITGGSRARSLASEYGVEASADFPSMLDRNDIDAVLLATPHQLHAEEVIAAASKGKHILVEKPMATSVADCDAMIAACEAANVTLSVIKTLRFRGVYSRAKRLIEEGRIGRIRMVQTTALFPWSSCSSYIFGDEKKWHSMPNAGGSLLDRGAHVFDALRWLIADEPVRVYGSAGAVRAQAWLAYSAMAQVDFSQGASAQVWTSEEIPAPGFSDSRYLMRVWGEKGIMEFEGFTKLQIGTPKGWELLWEQPPIDPVGRPLDPARLEAFYIQTQDFIDSLRLGTRPSVTGEDGRAAVEMVQAVYLSTLTGSVTNLPLPRSPGGFQFDGATVPREMIS
jgi:predicted dehydrogenase